MSHFVGVEYDGGLLLITDRSVLGDTSGFNFYLASYKIEDGEVVPSDICGSYLRRVRFI